MCATFGGETGSVDTFLLFEIKYLNIVYVTDKMQ